MFPYRHEIAFCIIAETRYILPTLLKPSFKLLLKSRHLNDLTTSPNAHSTDSRTELMDLLNSCMTGVTTAPQNGAWRWTRKGYAGSPSGEKA